MLYLGRTWKSKKCSLMRRLGCSSWGPMPHPLPHPFSQETWIATVLGSLSCSGGSKPRQCTQPYAPKQVFAWLGVQLWLGTPGQAVWEGGWVSGAVRMALGSEERRALCLCLLGAAQCCKPGAMNRAALLLSHHVHAHVPCPMGFWSLYEQSQLQTVSASTCTFEPLLCLGVETSSWHKGWGSWLGDQPWRGAVAHTDGRLCWNRTLVGPEVWRTVYLGARRVFRGSTKSGWFNQEVMIDSAQMGREASGRALSHYLSFLGCWPFNTHLGVRVRLVQMALSSLFMVWGCL